MFPPHLTLGCCIFFQRASSRPGRPVVAVSSAADWSCRVAQAHDQPSLAPAQPCCPPTLLSLSGFTDNARESLGVAKDNQSFPGSRGTIGNREYFPSGNLKNFSYATSNIGAARPSQASQAPGNVVAEALCTSMMTHDGQSLGRSIPLLRSPGSAEKAGLQASFLRWLLRFIRITNKSCRPLRRPSLQLKYCLGRMMGCILDCKKCGKVAT